jgi:hypothetical protein
VSFDSFLDFNIITAVQVLIVKIITLVPGLVGNKIDMVIGWLVFDVPYHFGLVSHAFNIEITEFIPAFENITGLMVIVQYTIPYKKRFQVPDRHVPAIVLLDGYLDLGIGIIDVDRSQENLET